MDGKVSLGTIVDALDLASDGISSFVNRSTGEVRILTNEMLGMAEKKQETEDGSGSLEQVQDEELRDAMEVLGSADWLPLPDKFEVNDWDIMQRFAQSLPSREHEQEVLDAIHGRGAFRMFKGTIRRLGIEEAWFTFKTRCLEDMARDWLKAEGVPFDDTGRGVAAARRS